MLSDIIAPCVATKASLFSNCTSVQSDQASMGRSIVVRTLIPPVSIYRHFCRSATFPFVIRV